jgi:hypothetical protein
MLVIVLDFYGGPSLGNDHEQDHEHDYDIG